MESDKIALLRQEDPVSLKRKGRSSVCCIVAVSSLVLVLMCVSFGAGLLLGWNVFDESSTKACNFNGKDKDWGSSVKVEEGRLVPVGDYISENILPENIKSNLELVWTWFGSYICSLPVNLA